MRCERRRARAEPCSNRPYPLQQRALVGNSLMKTSIATHWAALDQHFAYHGKVVDRFRHIDHQAVLRMWKSQTNEGASAFLSLNAMLLSSATANYSGPGQTNVFLKRHDARAYFHIR